MTQTERLAKLALLNTAKSAKDTAKAELKADKLDEGKATVKTLAVRVGKLERALGIE